MHFFFQKIILHYSIYNKYTKSFSLEITFYPRFYFEDLFIIGVMTGINKGVRNST